MAVRRQPVQLAQLPGITVSRARTSTIQHRSGITYVRRVSFLRFPPTGQDIYYYCNYCNEKQEDWSRLDFSLTTMGSFHTNFSTITTPQFRTCCKFSARLSNRSFCGCQEISPRSYRLIITTILQGHTRAPRGHSEIILVADPRKCGYAPQPTSVRLLTDIQQKKSTCCGTTVPQLSYF